MLFDVVCACFKIEYFINTRAYDLHKKILVSHQVFYVQLRVQSILALTFNKNVKKKILSRENEKYSRLKIY